MMPPNEVTMDRRTFLIVGAGAVGAAACGRTERDGAPSPGPAAGGAARPATEAGAPSAIPAFELEELTIAELNDGMAKGRWTSAELTRQFLARIEALEQQGPKLRAMIALESEAIAIATALDEERRTKGARGPLHGVPVVVKDNVDTAGRMATTAGSLALSDNRAARDAFIVERLRAAGAVVIGKTNLSEWANFRSTKSSSGWSAVGGQCRNPYVLDRNPCGSSSGTGAAVAASYAAAGVGTETDGSIVCPSNNCGLVGLKPTVGLVSRRGIVPISHSQDTAGPMARSVADAATLLGILAGADAGDEATAGAAGHVEADYTKFLDPKGLSGVRLGVARKHFGFHPGVDRVMEDALKVLVDAGAELVDPADLPSHGTFDEAEFAVLLYEFKAGLNTYLAGTPRGVQARTLEALIAFNEAQRDREMPYFGQDIFTRAQACGPLSDKPYQDALAECRRKSRTEGIDAVLSRHRVDAIVAPTGGPAWVTDLVNGDHFGGGSSTAAAVAGYPNITVPAGFIRGLPVGLSFFSTAWREGPLIRMAYAFERATRHRRRPQFVSTLGT
jgi:amidase